MFQAGSLSDLHSASPLLVWGLFSRLLGLVFLISFTSLSTQALAVAGERGVLPAGLLLAQVRRDFPGVARFIYFPTLLWLSHKNAMLRTLIGVGLVASLAIIYGGPWTPVAFAACYAVYLSLDRCIGLVFPWDCVMFEAGLFAALLPATHLLPDVTAVAAPAPALAWFYRLLLCRVLLGFGKFKFVGSTKEDWGYLTGFLVNQPLVSPFGWYLHKAPLWALKLAMIAMFFVEIPAPLMAMIPGPIGVLAGLSIAGLMLGIWACGNFGYFNVVIIALCLVTLDSETPRALQLTSLLHGQGPWLLSAIVLVHTLAALIAFPFNSFCAQSWQYWTVLLRFRPRILTWPFHALRILQPFRVVHPFGVFPPKTMPGVRGIPLIEVSDDGVTYRECPHQYSPTGPTSAPCFVAPHHPRGDQVAVYEGFGLGDSSVMHSLVGSGNPYGYTKHTGAYVLAQRILEGLAPSYDNVFFANGVFPPGSKTPKYVRATTHLLTPTTLAEHKATGHWWKREYIGPHLHAMTGHATFWNEMFLEPERWHFEDVVWRRRSRLSNIHTRMRAGDNVHDAVLVDAPELAPYRERFWDEFIAAVQAQDRTTWASLPDLVHSLRARYSREDLVAFERLLGRYSFALSLGLDPLFFDAGFLVVFGLTKPKLDVKSYFHLQMLCHLVICEGRARFESVIAEPMRAAELVPTLTVASGYYCAGIFRYDILIYEAQKLRLLTAVMEPKRTQFSFKNEKLTERMDEIAKRIFGVVEIVHFLREQFKGPRFEREQPERYPSFRLDPSGVVVRDDATDAKTVT